MDPGRDEWDVCSLLLSSTSLSGTLTPIMVKSICCKFMTFCALFGLVTKCSYNTIPKNYSPKFLDVPLQFSCLLGSGLNKRPIQMGCIYFDSYLLFQYKGLFIHQSRFSLASGDIQCTILLHQELSASASINFCNRVEPDITYSK